MRKILIFSTDDFIPPAGGAEIAVGEITKRLPKHKFDLISANLFKNRSAQDSTDNVRIHRLGNGTPWRSKLSLLLKGHQKALALHRKTPYDLIWAISTSFGGMSALRFKNKVNIPFLLTLQEGNDLKDIVRKRTILFPKYKTIFQKADGMQAISQYLYDWGINMGVQHPAITATIPNGVDLNLFTKPVPKKRIQEIRSQFGFPTSASVLITVSRLSPKNGVGDIIEALRLLPKTVCLVIIGFGPLEAKLKNKVKKYNLQNRVAFLGRKNYADLPAFLQTADIFIRPSLTEGLGNAFLEAMASGVLTIGTPVGGIPDFLKDNETGFFCEPSNPKSIVETINRVLALPEKEKSRIRFKASQIVTQHYSWDEISSHMNTLFETTINAWTKRYT